MPVDNRSVSSILSLRSLCQILPSRASPRPTAIRAAQKGTSRCHQRYLWCSPDAWRIIPGFEVEDADAVYKQWQSKPIELVGEVTDMGAGRTFTAKDPEGHY